MNRNLRVFLTSALVLAVLGAMVLLQPGFAQTPTPTPGPGEFDAAGDRTMRTVSVSGTGTASATPDTAVIVVGVQTDADTATAALEQNNQQMTALINALVGEGIARTNIQTQSVSLYPRYSDQVPPEGQGVTGQPVVSGYTASNTVEVRLTNIDQVGEILDQAVQSGGNVIQNIRFEVSDQEEVLTQAREAAVTDARQKAEQLAGLVDAQVGQVVSISESTYFPLPYAGGMMERGAAQDSAVPIEPGSQNVQVTVQVTWELTGTSQ